jgi:hypothetical protein
MPVSSGRFDCGAIFAERECEYSEERNFDGKMISNNAGSALFAKGV